LLDFYSFRKVIQMNVSHVGMAIIAGIFASSAALAATPAGSTGLCKDGTYSSNATKSGACSGHKGVKEWFAAKAAPATAATVTKAPAASANPAPAATAAVPARANQAAATSMAQAPGGGAGQVWVNSSSKVYHCPGTKYYGKTKQGQYMGEAAAVAAGDHADHGKKCSGK
jgi:hypothetical protein